MTGDDLKITVGDKGAGAAAEIQEKIFEPLFTTKPETGIGLGLSVTRRIIERYGGSVNKKSQTERPSGTTVEIQLPLASITMRL